MCYVLVGDTNGHIGLGQKCAKEVATAIRGGIIAAKLSLIPVRRGYWGGKLGLPHTVPMKVNLTPDYHPPSPMVGGPLGKKPNYYVAGNLVISYISSYFAFKIATSDFQKGVPPGDHPRGIPGGSLGVPWGTPGGPLGDPSRSRSRWKPDVRF